MNNHNKFDGIDFLKMGVSVVLMFLLFIGWEFLIEDFVQGSILQNPKNESFGEKIDYLVVTGIFIILSIVVYSFLSKYDCSICDKIRLRLGLTPSDEKTREQLNFILEKSDIHTQKEVSEFIRDRYNQEVYKFYFEDMKDQGLDKF